MEGQQQHLPILHRVTEKYSSTLSSSQGNAMAAPQPDSETGEKSPRLDGMLFSKTPGDLTDLDWLSPSSAALGTGGVYIQRGL